MIILNLLLFSCGQKDSECIPKRYDCQIKITDKYGNNLIGTDKKYKPDSIGMIINDIKWTIFVDSIGILWSYAGHDDLNNTKYYIYLSSLDTDTIDFKISRQKGDCFDSFKIDTFKYNNRIVIPDTIDYKNRLIYKIVK